MFWLRCCCYIQCYFTARPLHGAPLPAVSFPLGVSPQPPCGRNKTLSCFKSSSCLSRVFLVSDSKRSISARDGSAKTRLLSHHSKSARFFFFLLLAAALFFCFCSSSRGSIEGKRSGSVSPSRSSGVKPSQVSLRHVAQTRLLKNGRPHLNSNDEIALPRLSARAPISTQDLLDQRQRRVTVPVSRMCTRIATLFEQQ